MDIDLISLETIQAIAHQYGYWAVFCGILLENMGIPIPGETVTLVGGFLAGSDELNYWYVLGVAIAGATLGDNFGYWIGYYGGWPFLVRIGKLLRVPESQLLNVRDRFSANADKAVLLGRFVALLRILAGPLAGIVRMSYWRFLLCNLIGAATWASVMVSLTYFLGRLIPLAVLVGWIAQFTVLVLVIVLAGVAALWWLETRQRTETTARE